MEEFHRAKFVEQMKSEAIKSKRKSEDEQILDWLEDMAERLEIPVEELALNLHEQGIFKFDNIEKLLRIDLTDGIE